MIYSAHRLTHQTTNIRDFYKAARFKCAKTLDIHRNLWPIVEANKVHGLWPHKKCDSVSLGQLFLRICWYVPPKRISFLLMLTNSHQPEASTPNKTNVKSKTFQQKSWRFSNWGVFQVNQAAQNAKFTRKKSSLKSLPPAHRWVWIKKASQAVCTKPERGKQQLRRSFDYQREKIGASLTAQRRRGPERRPGIFSRRKKNASLQKKPILHSKVVWVPPIFHNCFSKCLGEDCSYTWNIETTR